MRLTQNNKKMEEKYIWFWGVLENLSFSTSLGTEECRQTYIQVTEVLIVVQGIADNKAVWNDKANICQSKNICYYWVFSSN